MMDGFTRAPRYVLLHDRIPDGPSMTQTSEGEVTAVYGFSDKPEYDAFLRENLTALAPYPLVKGFLKRQLEEGHEVLRLVVLNATSSKQTILQAATFQAIVESFELNRDTVEVSYELEFDETSGSYLVHSLAAMPSRMAEFGTTKQG